ncbi:MAG: transcriptional repressor [Oscillospiraceae bacterium]|nr:transcriptional repressor [Oscillospiraceae bacterium]
MSYVTKQQRSVLRRIEAHRNACVSAQELAEELRADGEQIGVATVYRQLDKLERGGSIHKVLTEEGAFYQFCPGGERGDCFLLKCERCGRIEHVDCAQLAPLYRHLEERHGFTVDPRRTMLYGICAACGEGEP